MADLLLKVVVVVWTVWIYSLVVYRLIRKPGRFYWENFGIIVSANLMVWISEYGNVIKSLFAAPGLILIGIMLYRSYSRRDLS